MFTALEEHEAKGYFVTSLNAGTLPDSVTRNTRILRRHDRESKVGDAGGEGSEGKHDVDNNHSPSWWSRTFGRDSQAIGNKVQGLLEQLDVKVLKDADLMQNFIVPEFTNMERIDQNRFMHQVCQQWPQLREQKQLVDA